MSTAPGRTNIEQKIIAILLFVIVVLLLAILVALIVRKQPAQFPRTPDDILGSMIAGEDITDDEWKALQLNELARPPLRWSSTATDWLNQKRGFHEWASGKPIVPEAWMAIGEWLSNDESYRNEDSNLDVAITNKPTGAQYSITGRRSQSGASCEIKFTGNLNWK